MEKQSNENATPGPETTTTQLSTNKSVNSYAASNYFSQQLRSNVRKRYDATHISSTTINFQG